MVTKLKRVDGELALVLDEQTRRELGIDSDTPIEARVHAGRLVVERADRAVPRAELDRVIDEMMRVHADTFEKLAK